MGALRWLAVAAISSFVMGRIHAADPKGGGQCNTDAQCHLCGTCTDSRCLCDAPWTGSHCAQLDLLPARAGSGYPSIPPTTQLPSNTTFTWGGAVVSGEDGLYHGFFTEYLDHCPMTYGTWSTQTQIRHATAKAADGPWVPQDIAVPDAAGNPVVSRAPDGTWLLYFTNHRWNGSTRNCTGPPASWGEPVYCKSALPNASHNMQCNPGISLAYSRSLNGPWQLVYDVLKFWATNPGAPVFKPDGSMLFAYKTAAKLPDPVTNRTAILRCIGLLTAKNWSSFPYGATRNPNGTFPIAPADFPIAPGHHLDSCVGAAAHIEDPSNLWRDKRGTVHMLFHENGWGGAAASADDGVSWPDYNRTRVAYPYLVHFDDGSSLQCAKREEPKVLLGDEGQPQMLITVCRTMDVLPNTRPTQPFPVGEPQYVSRVIMQRINTSLGLDDLVLDVSNIASKR